MKNVFLIGMPSSGKSTIGKRLARRLGYRFVDTDKLIVRKEGQSINAIFQTQGEPYFRELESRVLRSIEPEAGLIVATGGGMPCFNENMAYIKTAGISVFLDVPVEELVNRMQQHGQNDRPLFNHQDPALLETLRKRYHDRRLYYEQADLLVSGETEATHLLNRLRAHLSQGFN